MITGASGGGKSTLVDALGERGYSVMPESALSVLQEQEQRSASPLSKAKLQAFMEEVLERSIRAYDAAQKEHFERSIGSAPKKAEMPFSTRPVAALAALKAEPLKELTSNHTCGSPMRGLIHV